MTVLRNVQSAETFAKEIQRAWRQSAQAILEVASIAADAHEQLSQEESLKLATLAKVSLGTLSKLRMIHRRRARIEKYIDEVPAAWTIMYDLCRLSESQFSRLVDDNKLRPDLTTDTIKFYSALFARAPKSTDRRLQGPCDHSCAEQH